MKNLPTLIARRRELDTELSRLNASEQSMIDKREKLLDGLDLDNDTPPELTNLTVRLEAIPRKRAQIEAKIEGVDAQLKSVIVPTIRLFIGAARAEEKVLRASIHQALKQFKADLAPDDHLVNEVCYAADSYWQRIARLDMSLNSLDYLGPVGAAEELLARAAKHKIDIDVELPEPPAPVQEIVEETAAASEGEGEGEKAEVGAS